MLNFIIYYFGIELPEDSAEIIIVSFNTGVIALITLLGFIEVFGYLIIFYLSQKYGLETRLENKYPRFKWLINRYKNTTLYFIIVEAILSFATLIFIVVLGFYPLFKAKFF